MVYHVWYENMKDTSWTTVLTVQDDLGALLKNIRRARWCCLLLSLEPLLEWSLIVPHERYRIQNDALHVCEETKVVDYSVPEDPSDLVGTPRSVLFTQDASQTKDATLAPW
jgi:hypothetical protein